MLVIRMPNACIFTCGYSFIYKFEPEHKLLHTQEKSKNTDMTFCDPLTDRLQMMPFTVSKLHMTI